MRKGELTRRNIIRKSATIFNKKGYMTTSMSDIIQETNIQKGGYIDTLRIKSSLWQNLFIFLLK